MAFFFTRPLGCWALPSVPKGVGPTAIHPTCVFYFNIHWHRPKVVCGRAARCWGAVWPCPGPLQPPTARSGVLCHWPVGAGGEDTRMSLPPVYALTEWKRSLTSLKLYIERDR